MPAFLKQKKQESPQTSDQQLQKKLQYNNSLAQRSHIYRSSLVAFVKTPAKHLQTNRRDCSERNLVKGIKGVKGVLRVRNLMKFELSKHIMLKVCIDVLSMLSSLVYIFIYLYLTYKASYSSRSFANKCFSSTAFCDLKRSDKVSDSSPFKTTSGSTNHH